MSSAAIEFLSVTALVALGCLGWGHVALFALRRAGWDSVFDELGAGIRIVIGMGLFLAVGGVLLALHLAVIGVLLAWFSIGTIGYGASLAVRRAIGRPNGWRSVVEPAVLVVLGALLSVIALSRALVVVIYSQNDDDGAYLYLAKRILKTGALIDPFSQRRLVSLGGQSLFESIWLRFGGDNTLQVIEMFFCLLLLVVVVARTRRRRFLAVGVVVIGASLVTEYGIGPIANTSPSFSGVCFTLVFIQLLGLLRGEPSRRESLVFVLLGLDFAAAVTLRPYFAITPLVAIVIVVLGHRLKSGWRRMALMPAAALVALSGWAISEYESSRALFFPLTGGNYNPSFPGTSDSSVGVRALLDRFWLVFTQGDMGRVFALAVIVGAAAFLLGKDRLWRAQGLAVAAAGFATFVELAVLTHEQSGSPLVDILRFAAPTALAVTLAIVDFAWPLRTASRRATEATWARRRRLAAPLVGGGVALLAVQFGLSFVAPATYGANFRQAWSFGTDVLTGNHQGFGERYSPAVLAEYQALSDAVPPGSRVLAAVDYPSLLPFSRFQFATLDIVGSVSPPPGMPVLKGPAAVARYLEALGYQYVIQSNFNESGLYDMYGWNYDVTHKYDGGSEWIWGSVYAGWGAYFVEWQKIIENWTGPGGLSTRTIDGDWVIHLTGS